MNPIVWVVGQYFDSFNPWEIQGIYTSEQEAIAACVEDNFFVGPVELNTASDIESIAWPGLYYPRLQSKETPKGEL